jgi:hypothetical protein
MVMWDNFKANLIGGITDGEENCIEGSKCGSMTKLHVTGKLQTTGRDNGRHSCSYTRQQTEKTASQPSRCRV